jgi:hypothetical protein
LGITRRNSIALVKVKYHLFTNKAGKTNTWSVIISAVIFFSTNHSPLFKQTESLLCSVEEFVREYYKSELNFSHGLHGEGAVVNTVTGILFWDIIYDVPVPDAFRGPHQVLTFNYYLQ